jgi:hypothetical protein
MPSHHVQNHAIGNTDNHTPDTFANFKAMVSDADFGSIFSNGLEDPSKFTVAYDPATRIFTVTGATGAAVWVNGVRYVKEGEVSTTAHAITSGTWFLYYADGGVLTVSQTVWNIDTTAQLDYIYYNATSVKALSFEERHPSNTVTNRGMSEANHKHDHLTSGSRIVSGCAASGVAPATAWAVTEGTFVDEDIYTEIGEAISGGPYRILFRSGVDNWDWIDTSVNGIHDNATNPYYNLLNEGSWSLAAITANNNWFNYWLVVAPVRKLDGTGAEWQTFAVMGQNVHGSLAAAQGEDPASISWGNLAFQEFVIVGRATYRRVTGGASVNTNLVEVVNIRSSRIQISGVSPTTHNALSGRSEPNSHPASAISFADLTANTVLGLDANNLLVSLAIGTSAGQIAAGDHLHTGIYESAFTNLAVTKMPLGGTWNLMSDLIITTNDFRLSASRLGIAAGDKATFNPTFPVHIIGTVEGGSFAAARIFNEAPNAAGVKTIIDIPVYNGTGGFRLECSGNSTDGYYTDIQQQQTSGFLKFSTGGLNERMRLLSNGRLLLGITTSRADFYNSATAYPHVLQIEGTDFTSSSMSLVANGTVDSTCPYLTLGRSKSGSVGGVTAVTAGNMLGYISFNGADGTKMLDGAAIQGLVTSNASEGSLSTALVFRTNNADAITTERMRLSPSGALLLGLTAARDGWFNGTGFDFKIQQEGTGSNSSTSSLMRNSVDASGPGIAFGKSRGNVIGSFTLPGSADSLGGLFFQGANGSDRMLEGARIQAYTNGAPGASAMPGSLRFSTNAGGTSTTERMRIDKDGMIGINRGNASANARLEVLDATNPQLMLTYTAGSVRTQIETTSGGILEITPSGKTTTACLAAAGSPILRVQHTNLDTNELCAVQAVAAYSSTNRSAAIGVRKNAINVFAGYGQFSCANGDVYFIWVDDNGRLRISSTSAHVGTTSGTVVGTQT